MSLASVSGTIELLINFSINLSRWQINIRTDVWETFGRPLPPGHLACTWPQRIPHLAEAAKTSGGATTFSLSLSLLAQLTTAAPSTKSGEVRKVRLPSKQSRHHCKVSGSKHPHEVHARRARLPSDTWHYVVPRPVRICWMTSNLPTRVAKCCRETTSTGIMTRLWAVMRLLFQVVRMGQWQQCPRHVKWNLVGQIQNHFPAARSSWLLGSNVHDLHVSVHTRMRAFPTSLIYIYRHIHVCLCVSHVWYIYIYIYLFIYIYIYIYI